MLLQPQKEDQMQDPGMHQADQEEHGGLFKESCLISLSVYDRIGLERTIIRKVRALSYHLKLLSSLLL